MKDGAPCSIRTGPQAATVRFDNPATDGQSHPGALRFGGKEGIEDEVGVLAGKPAATSPHGKQDLTILGFLRPDRQFTAGMLHRFVAVEHEVHQDLLHLHPISGHSRSVSVEFGAD